MSKNKFPRRDQTPPPEPGGNTGTPTSKEEIATDVSEVARERLSGTDKTQTPASVARDAAEAAPGIAGTPADDDTAAKVEAAPAASAPANPLTTTGGGSESAPLASNPAGTGAATKQPETPAAPAPTAAAAASAPVTATAAVPTPPASGAARAADPDKSASAPTAPDAAPTAAAAATAAKEAEAKPGRPATPPPAAAGAVKPAPAARPAAAKPPAKPAAPPKPVEPDPAEVTSLRELVPDLTWERRHGYVEVKIPSGQILNVARQARALGYDYLSSVTAVDWRDRLEMLYHLYGWDYEATPGCLVIRADLPPEPNPLCQSLTAIWAGAELQEREIYDLFGIKFVGHPDLRRILLDDDFPGHPLRKDWTFDYEYVLVKHLKYGAEGQDAPPGGEEGFRRV